MKKYILITLLFLPVISYAQDMMSDSATYCKETEGFTNSVYDIYGTTATLYNGSTYIFNFIYSLGQDWSPAYGLTTNGCPRCYQFIHDSISPLDVGGGNIWAMENKKYWKSCITYFNYPKETFYAPVLAAKIFTFNFNGRLWYLQTITSKNEDSIYECYAQLPVAFPGKCATYWEHRPGTKNTATWVKLAAFQLDSSLYFISQQLYPGENTKFTNKWELQKYSYNAATNRFVLLSEVPLSLAGTWLGGLLRRHDPSSDKDYMIISTYDMDVNTFYSLGITNGQAQLKSIYKFYDMIVLSPGSTTVVPGSIKGCRNLSNVKYQDQADRFTIFTINSYKINKNYPLYYREFYFKSGTDDIESVQNGQLMNPFGEFPDQFENAFSISGALALSPHHFTNKLSNSSSYYDGYQQTIWLFFPSTLTYHKLFGVGLVSDLWQPSPSAVDTVFTSNLAVDTGNIATQLQSIYTLCGIVDGGPPCSVDWEKWDAAYPPGTALGKEPTVLELGSSQTQKIEYRNTFSDEFTEGASMKFSQHFEVSGVPVSIEEGVSASFSQAFRTMHSTGFESKYTQTVGYARSNFTQGYGDYIWAIPTITRYVYRRYPWWDAEKYDNYQNPVPNSLQYLFRNSGTSYISKGIPISGSPFRVADPDGIGLRDWTTDSVIYGKRGRTQIEHTLFNNPFLSKLTSSSWTANGGAINGSFESLADTSQSSESECTFGIEVTAGMKIPKIFQMELSFGYDVAYSNEVKTTSSFGHDIKMNINLSHADQAYINNKNALMIDLYLFKPSDSIHYWFYDSLPVTTQKPWYIAYVISGADKKINLLTPDDKFSLQGPVSMFSWTAENMTGVKYTFVISESWPATPKNVVYSESTGERTSAGLSTWSPVAGRTYYWAVRGVDAEGAVVWSDPRRLFAPDDQQKAQENPGLLVLVYPNPGKGKDIHVSILQNDPSDLSLNLYRMNGNLVYSRLVKPMGKGMTDISLTDLNLPEGVYIVECRSTNDRVVKKLVIL